MRRKRVREVPVGRVTVDCTPVTARVGEEVRNVISCPFDFPITCQLTETVFLGNFPVPVSFPIGCVLTVQGPACTTQIPATVVPCTPVLKF